MNHEKWRKAYLEGIEAAERLIADLQTENALLLDGTEPIDVFKVIVDAGIVLLFRPLTDALGYCLNQPTPGILVSSLKDQVHPRKAIQRLTAAHELGHLSMGHLGSIDYEIDESARLNRAGIAFLTEDEKALEVAAEAFAGRFLVPRKLLLAILKRQEWRRQEVMTPSIIYQLSLRLGISYAATCWALDSHEINKRSVTTTLLAAKPRQLKREVLGSIEPVSSWANAWLVREQDQGCKLTPEIDDTISLQLFENIGSGYRWDFEPLTEAGFDILNDENISSEDVDEVGGGSMRRVVFRLPHGVNASLSFWECRPWIGRDSKDRHFEISIQSLKPQFGFSDYEKSQLLMAA